MRPYQISPRLTASHPNSEVKRGRARAVLRWGTTREGQMLHVFFPVGDHAGRPAAARFYCGGGPRGGRLGTVGDGLAYRGATVVRSTLRVALFYRAYVLTLIQKS